MPVYHLTEKLIFPHPSLANDDGLLAIGGDLSVGRLLLAYANGIFPWYDEASPILWWSPNPRMVLYPDNLKVSESLHQSIRNKNTSVRFDTDFERVIKNCARVERPGQPGTWITPEMQTAYIELHRQGFAHSVETYYRDELVGGLYGVSLGRIFFGESMFHLRRDASKVALFHLVEKLKSWNFDLIDVQQDTPHLRKLGGQLLQLDDFLGVLQKSLKFPTRRGKWDS